MAKKCNNASANCGTILPSNCVDYVGDDLKSLDKQIDQCNLSVTDAIEYIDSSLKGVKDDIDVKKLSKACLSLIDKEDSLIIVINKLIAEICNQSAQIKELQDNTTNLDILASIINLDSNCLTGSQCSTDSTLKSLLMKMISEICTLKEQINSSSNLYTP